MKIDFEYLKKNFKLDEFLKNIERYNYQYMDEGDMLDRIICYGYPNKPDIFTLVDDNFHDELRSLAKSNTLLPLLTDNFEHVVPEIHIELTIKDVFLNCWYSKKNFTYYFFVDEYNDNGNGNCLTFKSKDKEEIMKKISDTQKELLSKKTL